MADEKPGPLVAGVDYTVEAGNWVFTAAFHLKRGYCCRSGCRHCPWGFGRGAAGDPAGPAVGDRPPPGRYTA